MNRGNQYTQSGLSPPTLKEIEHRIVEILFNLSHPITERSLLRVLYVKKQTAVVALRNLVRKSKVRRLSVGLNKSPYLYFLCKGCLIRSQNQKSGKSKRRGAK